MPWPLDQFSIAVTLTPQLHLVHSRRFILPRRPWRLARPLLSSTSVIGIGTSCVCPWLPLEASIRPSSSHDASVPPRVLHHRHAPHTSARTSHIGAHFTHRHKSSTESGFSPLPVLHRRHTPPQSHPESTIIVTGLTRWHKSSMESGFSPLPVLHHRHRSHTLAQAVLTSNFPPMASWLVFHHPHTPPSPIVVTLTHQSHLCHFPLA